MSQALGVLALAFAVAAFASSSGFYARNTWRTALLTLLAIAIGIAAGASAAP